MQNIIRQRKETQRKNFHQSEHERNGTVNSTATTESGDRQRALFGFAFRELTCWRLFVRLMSRPTDPAALGVLRFLYGVLLMIETLEKQGLGRTSLRKYDSDRCIFPVLYFLKPLPLDWMYLIYFIMLISSFGIAIGFMYRWCLVVFNAVYWYIHLLDMQRWNNHSYLFGLLGFLLLITDGNRYFSVDSLIWPRLHNQGVPLWNYTLFRFQVFLLYFYAGLKKMDPEWLYGHSQTGLAKHWVFDIFRPFLTNETIDLYIVHGVGFLLDLTLGFILFFDKSRKFGLLMALSFHAMNSQLFSIGMFPYMGSATLSVFCYPDWPRKMFDRILFWRTPRSTYLKRNSHCLYIDNDGQTNGATRRENGTKNKEVNGLKYADLKQSKSSSHPKTYHVVCSLFVLLYIAEQLFLPFASSMIFKGLTNWTGDLYGYSWNMMIQKYATETYIYIKDLQTGEKIDITERMSKVTVGNRWAYTPFMLTQFTDCLSKKLENQGQENFAINYDLWVSINHRFFQRTVDPNRDMRTARWSIFSKPDWFLPASEGFWEMREMKKRIMNEKTNSAIKYNRADFPGFQVSFPIHNDTLNITLEVLKGTVILEDVADAANITLTAGKNVKLLPRERYVVHTISPSPSYFTISKQTVSKNETRMHKYKAALEAKRNGEDPEGELLKEFSKNEIYRLQFALERQKQSKNKKEFGPGWSVKGFVTFLKSKYTVMKHGLIISMAAIRSILGGEPFTDYIKRRAF